MKINRFIKILCFGVLLMFAAALIFIIIAAFCAPDLSKTSSVGKIAFSKDNTVIAYTPASDTRYRFKTNSNDVDPLYLKMLLAAEDERFNYHLGVDPIAVIRSFFLNLSHKEIVSGASTLAMQVIRLNEPKKRTYFNKLKEAFKAVHLTMFHGRKAVLDDYLTIAPFGGGIEGVTAASLFWFNHLPDKLTPAEAALLVAIPRSPEKIRPDRFYQRAKYYRDKVLKKAYLDGIIKKDILIAATSEPLPHNFSYPYETAFHFGHKLFKAHKEQNLFITSIDSSIQRTLNELIASFKEQSLPDEEIAAIIIDNADHSICAYAGSKDYKSTELDLVQAVRSPGSALKPFAYALAFAENKLHPKTVLDDEAQAFGSYAPKNFTRNFKGTVPADYALYNSLNLPALTVLNLLGPEKFLSVINKNQRNIFLPKGAKAGLPIILGGCGISLYNLTALYTTLFNDGMFFYPKNLINEKTALAYELIEKKAARATFNILKNTAAPQSFIKNRQISYKTGTSYDFIDALSIGSSGRYTAGVWIGKPDGSSNYPKTGYNAAAPILYALLDSLSQQQLKKEDLPLTGALSPLPLPNLEDLTQNMSSQRLKTNKNYAKHPIKITFPQNNSKIKTTDEGYVNVIIEGGQAPYTLYINGIEQNDSYWFKVNKSGYYDLCVIDNDGNESLITIQIFT